MIKKVVKVSQISSIAQNKIYYRPDDVFDFTKEMTSGDDDKEVVIWVNNSDEAQLNQCLL